MKQLLYFFVLTLFLTACNKHNIGDHNVRETDVIYFQNNDFNGNNNAIIAYRLNIDGTLSQLSGSPFLTGGSGVGNPKQILGPSDSDQELKISDDGKFLLAVNSGSNTISVFSIESGGQLTPVKGSPFSSGGQTPVSIAIKGQYVFVVNKSQNPLATITKAPNYTAFSMSNEGALTPVPLSTVETTIGSSPANALVSNNGKFLFGTDFLGFQVGVGTLRSFTINNNGTFKPVANTPQAIPGTGGALGLWQHPQADVLYVGFPLQGKLGVYHINNNTGALDFQTAVTAGTAACWIRSNKKGDRTYTLNSGENTISIFNTANAVSPSNLGKFTLKNPGPLYMGNVTTSEPFSFAFSSSEDYLFVLNQHTNPDFSIGNYNMLHVLKVLHDGTLSEPGEPVKVPVPNTLRPKGVVVHKIKVFENLHI